MAIGMGLVAAVAAETLPEWGPLIMITIVAATVFFEIVDPLCTLVAQRYLREDPNRRP